MTPCPRRTERHCRQGQSPDVETVLFLSVGPLQHVVVFGILEVSRKGMDGRRVVLYGRSVILGTLRASFERYPDLEVLSLSPPFPSAQELLSLAPDVILFDTENANPEAAFALLGTRPGLLVIGIDPSTNQALVWSGRHLRELSTQDLVRVMSEEYPRPLILQERNHSSA
jgi:hypothetical protein